MSEKDRFQTGRHVGCTGTREGMTDQQKDSFRGVVADIGMVEGLRWTFHHGDCVGSDEEAAGLVAQETFGMVWIVGHPPIKEDYRAHFPSNEDMEPKDYLARDRDIVDATSILIATPKEMEQQTSGGTWYTVKYKQESAQSDGLCIIWPDGRVEWS